MNEKILRHEGFSWIVSFSPVLVFRNETRRDDDIHCEFRWWIYLFELVLQQKRVFDDAFCLRKCGFWISHLHFQDENRFGDLRVMRRTRENFKRRVRETTFLGLNPEAEETNPPKSLNLTNTRVSFLGQISGLLSLQKTDTMEDTTISQGKNQIIPAPSSCSWRPNLLAIGVCSYAVAKEGDQIRTWGYRYPKEDASAGRGLWPSLLGPDHVPQCVAAWLGRQLNGRCGEAG